MPRPHTEFIHAPQLAWQAEGLTHFGWPVLESKMLSRDVASGGCTALLRLPPGYRDAAFLLGSYFELFVLEGALEINGQAYGLDAYAFLPAGFRFQELASQRGAIVLAFFERGPQRQDSAECSGDGGVTPPPGTIAYLDTLAAPWTTADIDPSVQFLRLSHKVLRHVPATGEKTLLIATGAQTHPRDFREAQLRHDCVEELYLLGGDLSGDRGTMYEGAYFWRPPGIWHGPFGSRRGSLSLVRFLEGHHRNVWGDRELPFTYEPAHAPALPEDVPAAARSAWSPPRH